MHLSECDVANITLDGELCNDNGDIGEVEFATIMRREMHHYLQVAKCPRQLLKYCLHQLVSILLHKRRSCHALDIDTKMIIPDIRVVIS